MTPKPLHNITIVVMVAKFKKVRHLASFRSYLQATNHRKIMSLSEVSQDNARAYPLKI